MSDIFYQKDVVKFETCAECSSIAERDARIEALELAVERATANMVAAQNRAAELEKALRDVALMPCDCFRNSGCGSCSAREALKTLEAKG
jgi:hypothetical protein